MKLMQAIDLGQYCGLESPEESVNNILIHSTMMYPYEHIREEEDELIKEAKEVGIQFCHCGLAKFANDGDDCYICKKFRNLRK
jgi:tRNA(Ile)-lysidine synthase TilS/MesJ